MRRQTLFFPPLVTAGVITYNKHTKLLLQLKDLPLLTAYLPDSVLVGYHVILKTNYYHLVSRVA